MDGEFERARIARANRDRDGRGRQGEASAAALGSVASSGNAIELDHYLLLDPATALGPAAEGRSVQLATQGSARIAALLLGPGLPATGDYLIARHEGRRWVVDRGSSSTGSGTSGATVPNCICSNVPEALSMVSADPSCNYGMFQSCSIQYAPTPPEYAPLSLGIYSFLSVEEFPDVIAGGAMFKYVLTCYGAQFNLSRVYATSPYGSPFHDALLYTWVIGGDDSTCLPFSLRGGEAYRGSDASCAVSITGITS